MKKPKPVWLFIDEEGEPFAVSKPPELYDDSVRRIHAASNIRTALYVPAPTTKKRKAKRK